MWPEGAGRQGLLVAIVGPSGSGKDTVIRWLRDHAEAEACLDFVQRVITREDDGGHEDSLAISTADFLAEAASGAFAVSWQAHGLRYGLPASCLDAVERGRTVIVNGSRHALPSIHAVFARMLVIRIEVERGELQRRLLQRGRENGEEIMQRLTRPDIAFADGLDVVTVDNSGPVERAGRAVLAAIAARVARETA